LDGKPLFEPAFRRLVFSSFVLGLSTEFIIATLEAIVSTPVGYSFFEVGCAKLSRVNRKLIRDGQVKLLLNLTWI
jgi:hypothetical protein